LNGLAIGSVYTVIALVQCCILFRT
jgi:hypothetical protein